VPGEAVTQLLWPVMAAGGFLVLAALIIALGASSTAKYEFERNRVPAPRREEALAGAVDAVEAAPAARATGDVSRSSTAGGTSAVQTEQATAISLANHPAGKQRVAPDAVAAWWLVDESGDQAGHLLAGPFADQVDADWAALSAGLSESASAVHGVQRADGGIVRRQSPEEKAWLAELGDQLDRLPEDWDELLTDDDALTTLVVEIAAALVEAGLPVHDCAGSDTAGGVCLTPGPHYAGVVVNWHQNDRMSAQYVRGAAMTATVQETMNATVANLLTAMGFEVEPFGAGCSLVTDIRGRE
jgi:hypothetical protein